MGTLTWGTGVPNGAVSGNIGDLFSQTDAANASPLWQKEIGNGTNTGWFRVQKGLGVFDVTEYGAKGDGTTDDTTAIANAYAALAAQGRGELYFPPGSYVLSRLLVSANDVSIRCAPGAVFIRSATGVSGQGMLDVRGAQTGTTTVLSATAQLGAMSLSVSSSAGFTAGDYVEIESAAAISGQSPYLYETNRIASTGAGVISLNYPVRNTYNTSGPTTVAIRKVTPVVGFELQGGQFIGPGGTIGDGVRLKWCLHPSIRGVQVSNCGDHGIVLERCFGGTIQRSRVTGLSDSVASWGVSLLSCENVLVLGCQVADTPWDGINLSYGSMYNTLCCCDAYNCADYGFVLGHGVHGHHNEVVACNAIGCAAGGFTLGNPSYEGDDDNTLLACQTVGCGNPFMVRKNSARNRLIGCRSLASTASGFTTQDTATNTELIACEAVVPTNFGISALASIQALAGRYEGGIRISGAEASDSVLVAVRSFDGASHSIGILSSANRSRALDCVADGAAGGTNGIYVSDSKDVVVRDPSTRNNAGYGVRILETAQGNAAGSRVVGGYYSGNGSAPVLTNNAEDATPARRIQSFTSSTSVTPDAMGGEDVEIRLTGNVTINAPTNPVRGIVLRFTIIQDGPGGRTVTWNAVYKRSWSNTGNGGNKQTTIAFRFDGTSWIQQGAQGPYV